MRGLTDLERKLMMGIVTISKALGNHAWSQAARTVIKLCKISSPLVDLPTRDLYGREWWRWMIHSIADTPDRFLPRSSRSVVELKDQEIRRLQKGVSDRDRWLASSDEVISSMRESVEEIASTCAKMEKILGGICYDRKEKADKGETEDQSIEGDGFRICDEA